MKTKSLSLYLYQLAAFAVLSFTICGIVGGGKRAIFFMIITSFSITTLSYFLNMLMGEI
jgi:hypothetical protein